MPNRKGRNDAVILSPEEMAEINRITAEIMEGMDCVNPSVFERHVQQVLIRNSAAAGKAHEAALAAEETHTWEFGQHHISECRIDWCGRYRGQRRDSVKSVARQAQALEDFSRYGCLEPPPAPAGPAAYCRACAASGVGACDDFPYCPGGGKSRESQ
jgi:hypothetical protein